jgi:4-hydroxythreonine-4-phosphate dehydrogenase
MIYVSQGHECGIGIEVYIKSALLLNERERSSLTLMVHKESLQKNLEQLFSSFEIKKDSFSVCGAHFNVQLFDNFTHSPSDESLKLSISSCNEKDILFTLPTSKDQLFVNNQMVSGHTEYFRKFFKNENISMCFQGPKNKVLLATDHLPLQDVPKAINSDVIKRKIEYTLEYFKDISKVIITGLNPHAGENGLLGTEESKIEVALKELKEAFPKINFVGPIPSDTVFSFNDETNENELLVYMYHDQGLNYFKERNRLLGVNISLGLPFNRISVDHGTAFSLFGKNTANYMGCLYALKETIKRHEKNYGH